LTAGLGAADVLALPAVFDGDPVDGQGRPWVILPGVALVDPGANQKFDGKDDIINPAIVGDVDVVARSGSTYAPGSGVIPAPAASVAAAPSVVAGGTTLVPTGSEFAWQLIVSDGAASPPAGHPLTANDLDGRAGLALAYADLDGDGVIGMTNADAAGSGDNEVELQESWTPIGRRYGMVSAGLASGTMAVAAALPASKGGLGVVLAGGIIAGATSPLFIDGAWIATLLPCMWPPDISNVVGPNPGTPDPLGLVDIEYNDTEQFYCPTPNDPLIGTPYAIPLNGSSITNDLVRSISGPAVAPGLAQPIPAGFLAAPLQRLTPLVSSGGVHTVAQPLGAAPIFVPDDGPGGVQATIYVFPADRLGNQADVPFGGSDVDLEVSSGLRIVSPDSDGDPQHETITFASTGYATVVLDDSGVAGDGGGTGTLVASLDGVPGAALRVSLGGSAPTTGPLISSKTVLRHAAIAGTDRTSITASIPSTPALDFVGNDVTVTVIAKGVPVASRTLGAGSLAPNLAGTAWRYHDPAGVPSARLNSLVFRAKPLSGTYAVRGLITKLDLSSVKTNIRRITLRIKVGATTFESDLDCTEKPSGTATTCAF
jgi:hypothetical protein